MKVITTGLLNRFWTKGIKPWLDKRIKSYADLMVTTASGYTPDALAVKEGFTELNGKLANSFINYDQRIRLAIYTWNGNVVGGSTVCFGSIENYIPNGHVLVGLFLTPRCTVDITMSYYYTQIYAASKDFTGEIYYDALLVFIKS